LPKEHRLRRIGASESKVIIKSLSSNDAFAQNFRSSFPLHIVLAPASRRNDEIECNIVAAQAFAVHCMNLIKSVAKKHSLILMAANKS